MSELFEAIFFDCSTDIGLEDEHKDLLAKPLESKLFEQIFREANEGNYKQTINKTDENDDIFKVRNKVKLHLQSKAIEMQPTTQEIIDNYQNYLQDGIETLWVDVKTHKTSNVRVFPAGKLNVNGVYVDFFTKEKMLKRENLIGGILQTLKEPNLIMNQMADKKTNQRDDKRIYIKSFTGESKNYPNDHCKPIQLVIALQKQPDGNIILSLIHSVRNGLEKIVQKIAAKEDILYMN